MREHGSKRVALAALGMLAGIGAATAQEVTGVWQRDTGASRVRFSKCGEALCGTISWLKEQSGPAKVGQRIFYDMKPNGANTWSGSAFNPEDGKTYAGTMTLSGGTLTTAGCVMGGLICRSVKWTRMD
ncbi:hypothetical protein ARD30_18170 [Bosea thiooxidans]|uniref:Uncharacterized conserved protein, DUF2147 family n=1 Tax=Bosea thiooxidans TaxID=53254 RepID=A0A0Q3KI98_9HYPH|nr:DUF2147 domain-containing protein [Bosea thiooxidans]KQK29355.1 hypothetical protein ARD30_18170 [Bosea thiooxidans]SKC04012.1 Uncharacterized conserved protein, DUF2147 family [Bosea thiooxidans]